MSPAALETLRRALAEDVGPGDVTSAHFIPADHRSRAALVFRQPATLAGLEAARAVFHLVDPRVTVELRAKEGQRVEEGDIVLTAHGPTQALLTAERTALNLVQRLSGIATLTRAFVDAVAGTKAVILDTRKTTPGLREFERAAVRAGGGSNHRFGLFDRVLAKDNHLAVTATPAALQQAVDAARAAHPGLLVEIEADTLEQVAMLLGLQGIEVILLDNMPPELLRRAVALRGPSAVRFEASGGIRLETVRAVAETGVDFISVGALTHSAPAVDCSLEIEGAG